MNIFGIILLSIALSCNAQFNGKRQQLVTRSFEDIIKATIVGALVKNGQLTSCNLAVIDSMASVVAASCLDYSSGTTVDKNTKLEVLFLSSDNEKTPISVDSVTVHPNFNPLSHVNDIAIVQYKNNSDATWQANLDLGIFVKWDMVAYTGVTPNNATILERNTPYDTTNINYDDTCKKLSDMFETNIDDMVCASFTTELTSKDLSECAVPLGVAYGIFDNNAYLIGPYSFTAVSQGKSLCSYTDQRSYYTRLSGYIWFIQEATGRKLQVLDSMGSSTPVRINPNYTMVDKNFDDDNGIYSTKIGGNFFKYKVNTGDGDSSAGVDDNNVGSSDIDSSDNNDKGSGLSQREKAILAVCISVGGAIIIALIAFYMWRRRWRNSNLTDPIYRDVIETEIGGATVPAYALSSRVSRVQSLRGSIADNTPASLQGSVGNEQFSAHMRQGDLPPTYNDVVVERRQTLLASTEKPDKKKDNE